MSVSTAKRWIRHVDSVNIVLGFVCRVHRMYSDVSSMLEFMLSDRADLSLCGDIKFESFHVLLDEFYDLHALYSPDDINVEYLKRVTLEVGELLQAAGELSKQLRVLCSNRVHEDGIVLDELMTNLPDVLCVTNRFISDISSNIDGFKCSAFEGDVKKVLGQLVELNDSCERLLQKVDESLEVVDKRKETMMYMGVFLQDLKRFEEAAELHIKYVDEFIDVLNAEANSMLDRLFNIPDLAETLISLQNVVNNK